MADMVSDSARGSVVSALGRRVRVSAVRAGDVQCTRVREGEHDPGGGSDCPRVSCVRLSVLR